MVCSVGEGLFVERGVVEDYLALCGYHYCDERLCPYKEIFVLRDKRVGRCGPYRGVVGVIVYSMPVGNIAARNAATRGFFSGLGDRRMQMELINKYIRCIRRVIIEPRYRGIGLGARLVRETMPLMGVPIIESLAVMGNFNPFFEKAGMRAVRQGRDVKSAVLAEAFSAVGVDEEMFIDPAAVYRKVESLGEKQRRFIESHIARFLSGYGKRAAMDGGFERVRYVVGRLCIRPVYYIAFMDGLHATKTLPLRH